MKKLFISLMIVFAAHQSHAMSFSFVTHFAGLLKGLAKAEKESAKQLLSDMDAFLANKNASSIVPHHSIDEIIFMGELAEQMLSPANKGWIQDMVNSSQFTRAISYAAQDADLAPNFMILMAKLGRHTPGIVESTEKAVLTIFKTQIDEGADVVSLRVIESGMSILDDRFVANQLHREKMIDMIVITFKNNPDLYRNIYWPDYSNDFGLFIRRAVSAPNAGDLL